MRSRFGPAGVVLALGAAGGCLPQGAVCPDAAVWYVDADGDGAGDPDAGERLCAGPDGMVPNADDCDDRDAGIYLGAPEVWYDGIDQDCDGGADDDADGDGHRATAAGGDDCDDADADVHPGVDEVWYDGVDADCDGRADDDADSDGFGAVAAGGTDCDDADDDTHPGADEICDDGVDNDCDGAIGADCGLLGSLLLADAGAAMRGAASGEAVGTLVAFVGDLDGDGRSDLATASSTASFLYDGNGVAWIISGAQAPVDRVEDGAARAYGSADGDAFGSAVAGARDIDGDGYDDLLVGASAADGGGGVAYLFHGPVTGNVNASTADASAAGDAGSRVGLSLDSAGDFNGDGRSDVVIGGPSALGEAGAVGRAWVFLGPLRGEESLNGALVRVEGLEVGDDFGDVVAGVGDLDGDGVDEVAVGAPGCALGADGGGAAFLFSSAARGDLGALDGEASLVGESEDERASQVAAGGDVNGDGYADVLVGARGYSDVVRAGGAVFVWLGPLEGSLGSGAADAVLSSEVRDDWLGQSVSTAGDFDGDGLSDVFAGAPENPIADGSESPAAVLFLAPFSGQVRAAEARASFQQTDPDPRAGRSVAGGGDVDGDGFPDLLVGDPGDDGAADGAGAAWLLLGGGL